MKIRTARVLGNSAPGVIGPKNNQRFLITEGVFVWA